MPEIEQTAITGIVNFWREAGEDKWYVKDEEFDEICRQRFLARSFRRRAPRI